MNLKFGMAAMLLISLSGNAAIETIVVPHATESRSTLHAGVVEKKKAAIKLYPNPSTNGTIQIVSNTAGKLNFYIFDLDGTLLHQTVLQEKAKHTIKNLKKGVYTYDAFYNDEGIEHGQLIVK